MRSGLFLSQMKRVQALPATFTGIAVGSFQTRAVQQAGAEEIVHLIILWWRSIGTEFGRFVLDRVFVLGDPDFDTRIKTSARPHHDPLARNFDSIAGTEIANEPVAFLDFHQAVVPRNIREIQHNVVAFATSDSQFFLEQWNRVATAGWGQLSVHEGHREWFSWDRVLKSRRQESCAVESWIRESENPNLAPLKFRFA